jgi:hypothetical protein
MRRVTHRSTGRIIVTTAPSAGHRTTSVAAHVFTVSVVRELPAQSVAIRDTSTW